MFKSGPLGAGQTQSQFEQRLPPSEMVVDAKSDHMKPTSPDECASRCLGSNLRADRPVKLASSQGSVLMANRTRRRAGQGRAGRGGGVSERFAA